MSTVYADHTDTSRVYTTCNGWDITNKWPGQKQIQSMNKLYKLLHIDDTVVNSWSNTITERY